MAHNTNSMFSTGDAQGPFRRIILLATCTTYQQLLLEQRRRGAARRGRSLGLQNLLADTGLCPPS